MHYNSLAHVLCATSALFLITATNTMAQDTTDTMPAIKWTGGYVGGSIGWGRVDTDSAFDVGEGSPLFMVFGSHFVDGGVGTVHAGWNHQFDSGFVLGLEADWSFTNWDGTFFDGDMSGPTQDSVTYEVDGIATVRARFGAAFNNNASLIYLTAGAAYLDASYTACNCDNIPSAPVGGSQTGSVDIDGYGFVAGAGLEHRVNRYFSMRAEGLYYTWEKRVDTVGLTPDGSDADYAEIIDGVQVRIGGVFHFGALLPDTGQSIHSVATGNTMPAVTWSGFYVGGSGGWGRANTNTAFDIDEASADLWVFGTNFIDNGVGTVHAGWNREFGNNFVLGLEGDWSYTDWDGTFYDATSLPGGRDQVSYEMDWIATVRARFGATFNNNASMIYATAGAAYFDGTYSACDCDAGEVAQSVDIDGLGFVAGGGFEHKFNQNFSLRFEALYYNWEERIETADLTTDSAEGDFAEILDATQIRIGASYHF